MQPKKILIWPENWEGTIWEVVDDDHEECPRKPLIIAWQHVCTMCKWKSNSIPGLGILLLGPGPGPEFEKKSTEDSGFSLPPF